jgi:hypothetical protein
MWRVLLRDGSASDIANLTRAKDAALSLAMATKRTALEKALEAPPNARIDNPAIG